MTAIHRTRLRIANIVRDDGTQSRAAVDTGTVEQYAELIADGYAFDPVVVFYDGERYRLADGFHRVEAALLVNCIEIDAEVRNGGRNEAQWYSIQCNAKHGRPRTRADIVNAVFIMLDHPKSRGMSNREVANHVHVSEATIRRIRKELSATRRRR